jgi:hypothetical protein
VIRLDLEDSVLWCSQSNENRRAHGPKGQRVLERQLLRVMAKKKENWDNVETKE